MDGTSPRFCRWCFKWITFSFLSHKNVSFSITCSLAASLWVSESEWNLCEAHSRTVRHSCKRKNRYFVRGRRTGWPSAIFLFEYFIEQDTKSINAKNCTVLTPSMNLKRNIVLLILLGKPMCCRNGHCRKGLILTILFLWCLHPFGHSHGHR